MSKTNYENTKEVTVVVSLIAGAVLTVLGSASLGYYIDPKTPLGLLLGLFSGVGIYAIFLAFLYDITEQGEE